MSSRLRFWHPVVASAELKPGAIRAVKLAGVSIALFRKQEGTLGAVIDQCVHRRMKLSVGRVEHGRLVCPYHGWSFSESGAGESPSAPKMHACLTSYDCAESFDVIWLRARDVTQPLPNLAEGDGRFVGAIFNRVDAPLQLVIDNFSEVEHTVAMHPQFGLDPLRASEAVAELEPADYSVTMRNRGPAKMPPLAVRLSGGIRPGDHFHSDYTFRFDPPRSSVTHRWSEPNSGCERLIRYHLVHYFVPEDEAKTTIVTFGFLTMRSPLVGHFPAITAALFRRKIRETVDEDAALLRNLADKSSDLEGMKLSRFDSILGLTRERLRRIYDAT
jgi:phenylpropionate dioxygenase-like ring-hydroxylating dioxygenase large terminal subunit